MLVIAWNFAPTVGRGGPLAPVVALLVPAVVARFAGEAKPTFVTFAGVGGSGRVCGAGPDECDGRHDGDDSRSR